METREPALRSHANSQNLLLAPLPPPRSACVPLSSFTSPTTFASERRQPTPRGWRSTRSSATRVSPFLLITTACTHSTYSAMLQHQRQQSSILKLKLSARTTAASHTILTQTHTSRLRHSPLLSHSRCTCRALSATPYPPLCHPPADPTLLHRCILCRLLLAAHRQPWEESRAMAHTRRPRDLVG